MIPRASLRLAIVSSGLALAACRRDRRQFSEPGPGALLAETVVPKAPGGDPNHAQGSPFRDNPYGLGEGATLFQWFNCTGCHAQGGGAIGPPLLDEKWIYGGSSAEIFASIANGRPNGMPAFGKRLGADQVWQLVAYVQSLSGHVPQDVAPGRNDTMSGTKAPGLVGERPIGQAPPSSDSERKAAP
jgi:cytochrome c oxidase cbb3-type subunit 3